MKPAFLDWPHQQVGMGVVNAYLNGYKHGYEGLNTRGVCGLTKSSDEFEAWHRGYTKGESDMAAGTYDPKLPTDLTPAMTVQQWLLICGHSEVKPLKLTVENETFEGCSYTFTGEYTSGMDAVTRGQKKAGDKYHETRYYFLGRIPKCRQKRQALCFTCEGKVLYLSSHSSTGVVNEYNPWGWSFMLGIWPTEQHGEIDQYEPHKYKRVPITLTPA